MAHLRSAEATILTVHNALVFRATTPERLDVAIAAAGRSRREARRRIQAGLVVVNSRPVAVASRMLKAGDRAVVFEERPDIAVVESTDEWIAVNKPSNISTQPGESPQSPASMIEMLAANLRASGEKCDVYPVHRLDRATSGVLLFARSDRAAAKLSNAFAHGAIEKTYIAVVDGVIEQNEFTIDAPIDRIDGKIFGVRDGGRQARSVMKKVFATDEFTVVEVRPLTGRTHQIRVHLAHAGHPVAGDDLYGGSRADRLLLHAWKLESPDVGSLVAPLPVDFIDATKDESVARFVAALE